MLRFIFCIILISVIVPGTVMGQVNKDSILMNERTIDRPVTLHGGQLRLTGGFGFSINSKRYDSSGDIFNRNDEGLTDILNMMYFEVKYGITEFIGITTSMSYKSQGVRSRQELIIISPDPAIQISRLTEIRGFTDIFAGVDLRAPFKTRKFDLATTVGAFFPTAKSDPDFPEHTIETEESTTVIKYHYNENWGSGVTRWYASGIFKFRTDKFAASAFGYISEPVSEGESIRWIYQTNPDNSIEYSVTQYDFLLSGENGYQFAFEYQPLQWLAVIGTFEGNQSDRGWSEITTKRVNNRKTSITRISLGYEILITSKIWFRQYLFFPISGKNEIAPFGIRTLLSYNLFPFN